MPFLKNAIPESEQSIVRPVVRSVINSLMNITNLPENTTIFFPGLAERAAQPGGNISQLDENNRLPSTDQLRIEITEEDIEDHANASYIQKPEYEKLWENRPLEVKIWPTYASKRIIMNFRYRAKDRTQGIQWRDTIRTHLLSEHREDVRVHILKFHYSIPPIYFVILKEIHRLQENVEGYGEEWITFLTKSANPRMTNITDPGGKNMLIAIPETQTRALGKFDFEYQPEIGTKEGENETWWVNFTYELHYNKPIACLMTYPLMIHNQLLGPNYRQTEPFEGVDAFQQKRTHSMTAAQPFESGYDLPDYYSKFPGRAIPYFDEFLPRMVFQPTMRIFTQLVSLDADNPSAIMNIRDVEQSHVQIHSTILDFLEGEAIYMHQPRKSVFHLGMYRSISLLDPSYVRVNPQLDIISQKPLSLRDYHHVRLGVLVDWSLLDNEAKDRLRYRPDVVDRILDYIYPPGMKPEYKTIKDRYIPRYEFDKIVDDTRKLNPDSKYSSNYQNYQFSTVQLSSIIARRQNANH